MLYARFFGFHDLRSLEFFKNSVDICNSEGFTIIKRTFKIIYPNVIGIQTGIPLTKAFRFAHRAQSVFFNISLEIIVHSKKIQLQKRILPQSAMAFRKGKTRLFITLWLHLRPSKMD